MTLRIFRHFVPVSIVVFGFCEITAIFFAWHFYLSDHSLYHIPIYDVVQLPSAQLTVAAGLIMVASGLYYREVFVSPTRLAMQIAITLTLLFPVCIALNDLDNHDHAVKSIWAVDWRVVLTWLLCVVVSRVVFSRCLHLGVLKRRVLVLGTGKKAARIARLAAAQAVRQFSPVGYLHLGTDPLTVPTAPIDLDDSDPERIIRCAQEYRASEIVVATDDRRGMPVSELLRCRTMGIGVIDYLDFIEREAKSVDIEAVQPGWLIFSDGFRGSNPFTKIYKRGFDIIFSVSLLVFTLPFMLVTCVLILLESAGPVFYRQERVGFGGRRFVLLKFRSMHINAEKDGAPCWAQRGDARVTRIGRVIRKLRIDELPQLWNVLRGDMSVVGPRPERPAFVANFIKQIPFYAERHCVKPGVTGWAQINYPYGASLDDARNKLSYDLYYVKNHSIFLDLVIVLQTVRVILWADGAR